MARPDITELSEHGERPSDVEETFRYESAALNSRIEYIGHVYATMRRLDLPAARVLEAESLLGEIIYCFRNKITEYDKRLADRIDAFLRDELTETAAGGSGAR